MNKLTLINEIADDTGFSRADVGKIVESFLGNLAVNLVDGEDIFIKEFGRFKTHTWSARKGRNPKTGEPVDIPSKRVVKFKPSRLLNERVNNK